MIKALPQNLFLLTIFFVSCNVDSDNKIRGKSNIISHKESTLNPSPDKKIIKIQEGSITTLKFNDLTLSVHSFLSEQETEIDFSKIQNDSLGVYLGYDSEPIEDKLFSIDKTSLKGIIVEQSYETSIGVYTDDSIAGNERGYYSLDDWKHFQSKWKPLNVDESYKFNYSKFTKEESRIFNVPIDEVKKEISKRCRITGKEIKSVSEYPCEVGITKYLLRITGKRVDNGEIVVILLAFFPPIGC